MSFRVKTTPKTFCFMKNKFGFKESGGDGESRTRVRKHIHETFSERSRPEFIRRSAGGLPPFLSAIPLY